MGNSHYLLTKPNPQTHLTPGRTIKVTYTYATNIRMHTVVLRDKEREINLNLAMSELNHD